jgi:hypothetical protein
MRTPSAAVAVVLVVTGLALALERFTPDPSADVLRGSEEPFAQGLHARELPPRQAPQRWSTGEAAFQFRDVPAGPATLDIRLRGQRGAVRVSVDGVLVGSIPEGAPGGTFPLIGQTRGTRDVRILAPTFAAGDGRLLGALVDRVSLRPPRTLRPSLRLILLLLVPAAASFIAARRSGAAPIVAFVAASGIVMLEAAALWPGGLVRSTYAERLGALLSAAAILAALFAAWADRKAPGGRGWAFAAVLSAALVQGIAGTSPVMVVSDAVFHANKLAQVAAGDLFPTSVTQHARPFRFPYGVSFYVLLAPLARAGLDPVGLVRAGAAVAGVFASAALFLLIAPIDARWAGLAVLFLQLLPGVFDVYSFGNLSNAFGQSLTILFFAWWAGRAPGGIVVGALLLMAGALAHFSSFVVLVALVLCLAAGRGGALAANRTRLLAAALGLALAVAYYASFTRLIADQLPRLLEGGGRGYEASSGLLAALRQQVGSIVSQWGVPAMVLAWVGRPRLRSGGLDLDLVLYWVAGTLLLVPAVISPLDVRYVYALTLPVAIAAGAGCLALHRRPGTGRWLAWALAGAQMALALARLVDAIWYRYRP